MANQKKKGRVAAKLTRKMLKFSIENNDGVIAAVARELNISRQYIHRVIKKWKLEANVQEAKTHNEDLALDTVRDNMDSVDVALKYLSIQARKDALASRQKVTVEDKSGIKVTVENVGQADALNNFIGEDE